MNKTIDPKQLALADPDHPVKAPVKAPVNPQDKPTREQLLLQTLPPHIDPARPAFKSDMAKIDRIAAAEAAREQLGMNEEDFNWSADDSVILKEQRATAVYFNKSRELVIRQQAAWDQEEDSFVYIAEPFQQAFLDKLCDIMGIGGS
jgi:hypothetical protein